MILTEATRKLLEPVTGLLSYDRLNLSLNDDGSKFIAHVYGEESRWPSRPALGFMSRFPEKRKLEEDSHGGEVYELGATDYTVQILDHAWPSSQLEVFDVDTSMRMAYFRATVKRQELLAEHVARFKEYHTLPNHDMELHPEFPLEPFQQVASFCSMGSEGYALFMEQGTGKTATTIARIMNECRHREWERPQDVYKVIVACPRTLRTNWEKEFDQFATEQGRFGKIRGGKFRRMSELIDVLSVQPGDKYAAVILNYEMICGDLWGLLSQFEWDLAIIDESQAIKNPNTRRWKRFVKLRDISNARMCLTGTPIANTLMDLYGQLEFLGEGWSGFSSYKAFRDFHGVYEERGKQNTLVGFQNVPFLQERLARCSVQFTKEEVLPELPDRQFKILEASLTQEQSDYYQQLQTALAVEIENEIGEVETATQVNNVLTKLLRLAQITCGFLHVEELYNDDGSVRRPGINKIFAENPKLDLLISEIKATGPLDKCLVWCNFIPGIQLISDRLEKEGIKFVKVHGSVKDHVRDAAVDAFNDDPTVKCFVGNPAAGGAGLNLIGYDKTRADESKTNCTYSFYYSYSWSSLERSQSQDRNHRRGTRKPVMCVTLMCEESVDEVIFHRVQAKMDMARNVQDIRAILQEVLGCVNQSSLI